MLDLREKMHHFCSYAADTNHKITEAEGSGQSLKMSNYYADASARIFDELAQEEFQSYLESKEMQDVVNSLNSLEQNTPQTSEKVKFDQTNEKQH